MQDLTSPAGDLEPIERAPAGELRALQLARLRWTLRHAYTNVPFYRTKFDAAGVSPEDCRSLSDLAGFPVTCKHPKITCVHGVSWSAGTVAVICVVCRDSSRACRGPPGHTGAALP